MSRIDTGTRFIRAGSWLLLLGFLMSVAVVVHYVVGGEPPGHEFMGNVTLWWGCPWTLPTAIVLGGALCMIVIGTVHTALGRFPGATEIAAPQTSLRICETALVGVFLTGCLGYFVVDAVWPSFYYQPIAAGKNVWLLMQLGCMVLLAAGVALAFADIRRAGRAITPTSGT
jgi:hypothetical protein